ncbi:uncharacterized protein BP01DRAFT_411100 [Aspergillus saccharolyticus JOP 1030-1]|uniref:F-box domain-containing protein n=1 Tax=Aspergillus saccharolyticus JOP 1030-1 TaxID=1450539 RepID=A0A318ZJP5_9EURO|nr:hypothetical protein BP01DRAFT_411100 [Aspergillus saccharolyticus JOP 1030-1]PYH47067.1 hypothetical protein BP01DRAFT_411100 [Aspergillus saccharolyticus JOP 1030-1]
MHYCCYHVTVENGEKLLAFLDNSLRPNTDRPLALHEAYTLLTEIDQLEQEIRERQWIDANLEAHEHFHSEDDPDDSDTDESTDVTSLDKGCNGGCYDGNTKQVATDGVHIDEKPMEISKGSPKDTESREEPGITGLELANDDKEHTLEQNKAQPVESAENQTEGRDADTHSKAGSKSEESIPKLVSADDDHDSTGLVKHKRFEKEPCSECSTLNKLEPHRLGLRKLAMKLSRPSIRPLTIFDLPNDLLLQIFEYFRDFRVNKREIIWWAPSMPPWLGPTLDPTDNQQYRKTIPSVRLVCRLFNELASPLLCSILLVQLDQQSIDRADQLSKCPHIAQGIRGIKVGLAFRIKDHESDIKAFAAHSQNMLEGELNHWIHRLETAPTPGIVRTKYGEQAVPLNAGEVIRDNYRHILHAMKPDLPFLRPEPRAVIEDETNIDIILVQQLRDRFEQGHREYIRKYAEQVELVKSGSFSRSVAACFARLPRADSLGFCDSTEATEPWRFTLLDRAFLVEALSHPLEWEGIQMLADNPMVPGRLLFELPLEIRKAGKALRNLHVSCFPCEEMTSMMPASDRNSLERDKKLWSAMRKIFKGLRSVSYDQPFNHAQHFFETAPVSKAVLHLKKYLKAMFSGPDLERVFVFLNVYGDWQPENDHGILNLTPLVSGLQWKHIKTFQLTCAILTESELLKWCATLGPRLENLFLAGIQLIWGSWAPVLDALREKVAEAKAHHSMMPHVHMDDLQGAEMDKDEFVEVRAYRYVCGFAAAENPCRVER